MEGGIHVIDRVTEDGRETMSQLSAIPENERTYNLLIMDHHLSGLNGLQVMERISNSAMEIPVIVTHRDLDTKMLEQYYHSCANYAFRQPLEPKIKPILNAIDNAVQGKRDGRPYEFIANALRDVFPSMR